MAGDARELSRRLARNAETACRYYLSNGRKEGRYWLVGDVYNAPGRSLFVRLTGADSGKGAAGKWTDAATGDHGDLLDVIAASCGFTEFNQVLEQARRFLSLPETNLAPPRKGRTPSAPAESLQSARRLFAASRPISGTLVATYLRRRGIGAFPNAESLRFHPSCYYRPDDLAPVQKWPAMIASVTDVDRVVTGVHRTWLDPTGLRKAPIAHPRRAMGHLLGNAVRFGSDGAVMAAGEGIETVLSLKCVLQAMPMMAALSAGHLGAMLFPAPLRRLYVACDNDPAGAGAFGSLTNRALAAGIEAIALMPRLSDFNEDLQTFGIASLRHTVLGQLLPEDAARFLDRAIPSAAE